MPNYGKLVSLSKTCQPKEKISKVKWCALNVHKSAKNIISSFATRESSQFWTFLSFKNFKTTSTHIPIVCSFVSFVRSVKLPTCLLYTRHTNQDNFIDCQVPFQVITFVLLFTSNSGRAWASLRKIESEVDSNLPAYFAVVTLKMPLRFFFLIAKCW